MKGDIIEIAVFSAMVDYRRCARHPQWGNIPGGVWISACVSVVKAQPMRSACGKVIVYGVRQRLALLSIAT